MPDRPDWSKYLPGSERHSLQDMSELAARIGSPVTYDRRGEVLWYDTFQEGYSKWYPQTSGAGASISVLADYPYRGGFCSHLVGGSNQSQFAQLQGYLSPPALNKWGVELAIYFVTNYKYFTITLARLDGVTSHVAIIRLNEVEDIIQYQPKTGANVKLADLPDLWYARGLYRHLKLVVDFENDEYVRFMLNENEYDMSGIALRSAGAAETVKNQFTLCFTSRAGENDEASIGQVIVTANEP